MKNKSITFQQVIDEEQPLILAGAFDALSARLIEQAGFKSYFVSGFSVVGARYGVPDVGLRSLGDISAAVRDIVQVTDLPAFIDIDDGYGDVKNAVQTLHIYENMGVAAVMIEDQSWPKRCGHMAGKNVVPMEFMEAKVRAMVGERMHPDTFIIARTDARAVHGFDDALRRAECYLNAGADGLFIEAPETVEELEQIGRSFDVPLLANPLEGGKTPILSPKELSELGFNIIPYGITLILRVTRTMQMALDDIRSGEFKLWDTGVSFEEYKKIIGFDEWTRIENEYKT